MTPHLVLVGATAAGKSELASTIARRAGDVELVSMDSMQVYRGMDIGTAKPTPAEQAEVPHHLLDVADPAEEWSVARHQRLVVQALEQIEGRGRRAVLVGGTGLYVQAVVDALELPGQWPQVRAELDADADRDLEALYGRLAAADPSAAARIGPANRRRIVRALEVTIGSGRPFSSFGPGLAAYPATGRFRLVGLAVSRPTLDGRIAARFDAQLAAGFLDEVRVLAERPAGLGRTAGQALGYRELLEHVAGHETLEEATVLALRRTRRFARRQEAWFRRDPRVRWAAHDGNPCTVLDGVLEDWAKCS